MTYGTTARLKIRLQAARLEKTGQLYFLELTLPPVLAKRLHISNDLGLGVYDPLSPKNTSLIQTVTHLRCHFAMNASEWPRPLKNANTIPWALPISLYCHASFLYLPLLATCLRQSLRSLPLLFLFLHGYIYIYIYISFYVIIIRTNI